MKPLGCTSQMQASPGRRYWNLLTRIMLVPVMSRFAIGCGQEPRLQLPSWVEELPPAVERQVSPPIANPHQGDTWSNSYGMTFVYIAPGDFMMGSPPTEERHRDNELLHKVRLTKGYWIGETEVTRAEFAAFIVDTGYVTFAERLARERYTLTWHSPSIVDTPDHPAAYLTWEDAKTFCAWISDKEGRTYRLPTEAEWEYACRAGTTTPYHTGETLPEQQANFLDGNALRTRVRTFAPNQLGVYDMHGNVAEWCEDWYGSYQDEEINDPRGPDDGTDRVVRGGGIAFHSLFYGRSAARFRASPIDGDSPGIGFRVVMENTRAGPPISDGDHSLRDDPN